MTIYIIKDKINTKDILLFVLYAGFYLLLFAISGVVMAADTNGYIAMVVAREPGYPLLLAFFRSIFGENNYLVWVCIFQNILAAYAAWKLTVYIKNHFQLPWFILSFIPLIFMGTAMLCQFAAKRASYYTNSILSEGVVLSLWILFFQALIEIIYEKKRVSVIRALLYCIVMMEFRKQMMETFIILFAVLFFVYCFPKFRIKNFLLNIAMILAGLLLATLFDYTYNYMMRGEFIQHTSNAKFMFTTVAYTSDKEDIERFEDEEVKKLFREIITILEEKEYTYQFADRGLNELANHYSDNYDKISLDTIRPFLLKYGEEKGLDAVEQEVEAERIMTVMRKTLLVNNISQLAKVYAASIKNGLVNTVAKRHPVLDAYALFIYIIFIALMLGNWYQNRESKAVRLAIVTMLALIVNVGVTAAFIFAQTRYMIYNMPLFYIALLVLIFERVSMIRKKRKLI